MSIGIDSSHPNAWSDGIQLLAWSRAAVLVTVERSDVAVSGTLVAVADDGGLVIEQPDQEGPEHGSVVWLPISRVVSVSARYQRPEQRAEAGSGDGAACA